MILKKSINHNENMTWSNNKHLIFHKIMNQFNIHSKSFNNSKWIYFVNSTQTLFILYFILFKSCLSDIFKKIQA
jgi:hypothetical protein